MTLTFVLSRAGRVLLVVKQVSPTCKVAGRVSVYGRKGLNRVRFAGRLRGESLQAGTYTIAIRRPRAPVFKRVTVVIVSQGIPTRLELFASRAANVCTTENARDSRLLSAPGDVSGAQANPAGTVAGAGASPPELRERVRNQSAGVPSGGVLGTSIQEAVRNIRPAVVALLALAIMLLALASLPGVAIPDRRINDALVRHRIEIAGLGAAALVATAVAFLLG